MDDYDINDRIPAYRLATVNGHDIVARYLVVQQGSGAKGHSILHPTLAGAMGEALGLPPKEPPEGTAA